MQSTASAFVVLNSSVMCTHFVSSLLNNRPARNILVVLISHPRSTCSIGSVSGDARDHQSSEPEIMACKDYHKHILILLVSLTLQTSPLKLQVTQNRPDSCIGPAVVQLYPLPEDMARHGALKHCKTPWVLQPKHFFREHTKVSAVAFCDCLGEVTSYSHPDRKFQIFHSNRCESITRSLKNYQGY